MSEKRYVAIERSAERDIEAVLGPFATPIEAWSAAKRFEAEWNAENHCEECHASVWSLTEAT